MSEPTRADPDLLLAAISKLDSEEKRGKLKIFFGMAAGVGKTYAMLKAARQQQAKGRDVVIGYLETHGRKETDALAEGLPVVARKQVEHRNITLSEMDLDAVIARRPELVLVDELAHTNAPGSRHPKRYQDVLEILAAGIDVYSTVNVQHVASRSDTVREITGANSSEIVPDSVFDLAEIELIDLPPEDLIKRLDEGKVYLPDRAEAAMFNFFREGNLTALREMALRVAAERVGHAVRDYMQVMQIEGPWKTGHRLLVGISASPYSEQMIHWTRRLADSLHCEWLAVYVETSRITDAAAQATLNRHLALARDLGAEVITTADEDIVRGLIRVARQHNISQIVVGKPGNVSLIGALQGANILRRLVRESGDIDIHVVRADKSTSTRPAQPWKAAFSSTLRQYVIAMVSVVVAMVFGYMIQSHTSYRAVALVFLLEVAILAPFVGRGPILAAATASALVWDFFFLPPLYTFYIYSAEDAIMFVTYFVIAIVLGQLIARIRAQERTERSREDRATALYLLTREMADAVGMDEILQRFLQQISSVFKADAAAILPEPGGQLAGQVHPASAFKLTDKEQSVASWVFQHGQAAGRFTDNLPLADALYLPMATPTGVVGVIGLRLKETAAPSLDQRNLLDAFVRQGALLMDRQRLREAAENSKVIAESERLGKTLLDSVSHEIRTPVAALSSAASALADRNVANSESIRHALVDEIQLATQRLNRIVGNLLDITRLESGHLKPKLDWCDVGDLINVTRKAVATELADHPVSIDVPADLPLVQMDFMLMEQALTNLLLNASIYTPAGTPIEIRGSVQNRSLALSVSDRGPGLPSDIIPRLFEKFYRLPGSPAGGTGLGLSIVKGFLEAQGGTVEAANRPGGGAVFSLNLPVKDPPTLSQETR